MRKKYTTGQSRFGDFPISPAEFYQKVVYLEGILSRLTLKHSQIFFKVPPYVGWGINVQKQMVKVVLALLLVASLALVITPVAMGAHSWNGGKNGKMHGISEIYDSLALSSANASSATFSVLGSAIKDTSGNVTMITPSKPVQAQYFIANKTFTFSGMNKTRGMHPKPMRTSYNSATINPAGASAVVAIKNVTMLQFDNKTAEFQFTGLAVYLPSGKVVKYTFSNPVKIVKSWSTKKTTISDPTVVSDIVKAVNGGAKFPANAAPVPLKTIDA